MSMASSFGVRCTIAMAIARCLSQQSTSSRRPIRDRQASASRSYTQGVGPRHTAPARRARDLAELLEWGLYCLPRYTKAQISPRAPVQPRPPPSQRIEFGTCTLLQLIRLGFTMYTPTPPKQSTARAANGALPNIAFLLSCRKPRRTSLSDGRGWSLGSRQPASPNGLDALVKSAQPAGSAPRTRPCSVARDVLV